MTILEKIKAKKFRCSRLSELCSGFKMGLSNSEIDKLAVLNAKVGLTQITEKQEEKLVSLYQKPKLTPKQSQLLLDLKKKQKTPLLNSKQQLELAQLQTKRDAPPVLSKGALTYVRQAIDETVMGRSKDITNAAMEKGTLVEGVSLTLLQNVRKLYVQKNDKLFDHHPLFRGTPDSFNGSSVIDIKSSYEYNSFPLTMEKVPAVYLYQLLGYCILTEREHAMLCYCLVDSPPHIVDDALRRLSWQLGTVTPDSLPRDLLVENVKQHIYTAKGLEEYVHQNSFIQLDWFANGNFIEIPEQNRVRTFDIVLTDEKRDRIESACRMAKEKLIDMFISIAENYQEAEDRLFLNKN